jgi:hypothetical protein
VVDKRDDHSATDAQCPKAFGFAREHRGERTGDLLYDPELTVTRCHEHDHADGTAWQEVAFNRHLTVYEALLPHQMNGGVNVRAVAAGTTRAAH